MKEATSKDKGLIVSILTESFQDNQSVNYLIPADNKRLERIRALMEYSYETCRMFGKVYLSDDKSGCALISFPERKKTTLKSLWLEVKLILTGIGFSNISKAINREKEISKNYPVHPIFYLWFIGVLPEKQNNGVGKQLMSELLAESERMKRPVYLETSTLKNLPWYKKFGLDVYNQLNFGYNLFLIRNEQS
ncbi:GNAT family N-acetyltransferase [Dyadobacter sp. CY323]|uniref:GNAT family N-acetyltransferase n=1 Tax=Dyadobacter sp. CY323 TaxID=2907302 RepID=UPI001F19BC18|nr:GNAT family N-acetyltransferase [Dyadobacter sp. CY323]MCE6989561.1 GNAT family N-acetyltransferase [Dyadobacter sp. CY323]